MANAPALEGASAVVEWFGVWPSFHDCEVIGVDLRRHDVSRLQIHAFIALPTQTRPPYLDLDKHALVTFSFMDIVFLELAGEDFHRQNVIRRLSVTNSDSTTSVEWSSSYGVAGRIEARHVSVSLVGGIPSG